MDSKTKSAVRVTHGGGTHRESLLEKRDFECQNLNDSAAAGTNQNRVANLAPVSLALQPQRFSVCRRSHLEGQYVDQSFSAFMATTRPVRANHLFSIPVRPDC
jgi:hypothetical protein